MGAPLLASRGRQSFSITTERDSLIEETSVATTHTPLHLAAHDRRRGRVPRRSPADPKSNYRLVGGPHRAPEGCPGCFGAA